MLSALIRGGSAPWLLFFGFWAILCLFAAAELWRPLHDGGEEPGGRIAGNVGFGVINAAIGAAVPVSTVVPAQWAAAHGIGLMNHLAVPFLAAAVATVLVRSLATYVMHRLSHAVPLLWRVHRVHHSDTRIDLSTGFRNHPLELAIVAPFYAVVTVACGLDPRVLAVYEAVGIVFTLWDHANLAVPEPADRLLRRLLVTPAVHHIHHSSRRADTDSNYGEVLTLWDRVFGTYREKPQAELRETRFGLGDAADVGASSFLHQLRAPFAGEAAPSSFASEA
ncbi:MAG: sterol desaturase family protein [Alphaproteobacteria bacterium]|nr:sterol desaturase family protein [Alphaproteobacteria bacterium]